jgi:hypothetical protein
VGLVQTVGTKALLLDGGRHYGRVLREVDRSYYHADAYRYPLAMFTLPDGRTGMVHCPEHYNRLEIDVAATGERLTESAGRRQPSDFFHSRLAVSADGARLLSAGWVWHPWGCLDVFDLAEGLGNPRVLDGPGTVWGLHGLIQAEVSGACFVEDGIVVSTTSEENDPEDDNDLGPNMLARWSERDRQFLWRRELDQSAGDLAPIGNYVLALNGHPRLFDPADGELLHEWPDIDTGTADSSIVWDRGFSGPARVAVDSTRSMFAVTDGEQVHIVSLGGI